MNILTNLFGSKKKILLSPEAWQRELQVEESLFPVFGCIVPLGRAHGGLPPKLNRKGGIFISSHQAQTNLMGRKY
jgi:hypothetical protein